MRNGWRAVFAVANVAAETLVSVALAVSGLYVAQRSVHLAVLGELAAACLIAWSGSADSSRAPAQRRGVLAGLTVVLVVLTALEAGLTAAVLVGLAFAPALARRTRAITAVLESEVQGGRLAWDVSLLSVAWLYPVVTGQGMTGVRSWLAVVSVLVVVARLLAMHSAQMQATSLAVVQQSRSTVVRLLAIVGLVFGVLILADVLPRFRLVLVIALAVGIVVFAILLTWRALIAGFGAVLLLYGFSALLRALITGHKHAIHLAGVPPITHLRVPHKLPRHPWWTHVPWGWIGLGIVLCVVVVVLLRMRVPRAGTQPNVQSVVVERERLAGRRRSAHELPQTPMRRVVARWLRQRVRSHPVARGETLRTYVRRELADHLPEVPDLAGGYDDERYGLQPHPQAEAARIEAALREAGLWRR